MAQPRPGHSDDARHFLDQLGQLLQHDSRKNDAESQAFLREAESLIR